MLSKQKPNKSPAPSSNRDRLERAKKSVSKQAALAVFTIVLTLILMFAMTAAWNTNVIQAGNLVFTAQAWGFDGTVTIDETAIYAAPGDRGVVGLTITNATESVSNITVSISKETLGTDDALKQRIYFYVDETVSVNGETVQRQYLNNSTGYNYMLYGWNSIILSESVCTDAPIMWEWVYDVVGYYFVGTVADGSHTVEDYLRPVEYDFMEAQYDENGNVLMVDAETSVQQFLADVTAADGYEGAYTVSDDGIYLLNENNERVNAVNGCYPIDEENGVWLYLCSRSEIDANTKWDTDYASLTEEERRFNVRVSVSAQQVQQTVVTLDAGANLGEVLNANSGNVVQLPTGLVLTEPVTVDPGVDVTLDLNGNQITYTGEGRAFTVSEGASLTVTDGSVVGNEGTTIRDVAFSTVGGQLTLSGVDVSGAYQAINVDDRESENGGNSVVRVVDCELVSDQVTVFVYGNGVNSAGKTQMIIQNSTVISETYAGIVGNGSVTPLPGSWGTDIQVIDSTVTGYYAAIYHPQPHSSITVSGSTLSGMTGIAVKGGDLLVIDSTVAGTGKDGEVAVLTEDTVLGKSGWQDTGDGIYVETNYEYAVSVTVTGSSVITHTASTAQALRMFHEAPFVTWDIQGGTFDSDVTAFVDTEVYECTNSGDQWIVEKPAEE